MWVKDTPFLVRTTQLQSYGRTPGLLDAGFYSEGNLKEGIAL